MKILAPKLHGIIDYVSVAGLLLAPTIFGLQGIAATFAYLLAGIHLLMTVLTDFPLGAVKLVPLKLHGLVEIVVGVSLLVLPWALASMVELGANGRYFYSAFGAVLIVVWAVTDYAAAPATASA
ncbi:MAG TPA: hypothetical protein VH083_10315 [Myxococcales bacterium]|nr:hypothetical protein [Myxococcales bacterium]